MTTFLTDFKTLGASLAIVGGIVAADGTVWTFLSILVVAFVYRYAKEKEVEKAKYLADQETDRARIAAEKDKFIAAQATEQAKIVAETDIRLAEIENARALALLEAAPKRVASLRVTVDGFDLTTDPPDKPSSTPGKRPPNEPASEKSSTKEGRSSTRSTVAGASA